MNPLLTLPTLRPTLQADLELVNAFDTSLDAVAIVLSFSDAAGNAVDSFFSLGEPMLSGFRGPNNSTLGLTLPPITTGMVEWLILPNGAGNLTATATYEVGRASIKSF